MANFPHFNPSAQAFLPTQNVGETPATSSGEASSEAIKEQLAALQRQVAELSKLLQNQAPISAPAPVVAPTPIALVLAPRNDEALEYPVENLNDEGPGDELSYDPSRNYRTEGTERSTQNEAPAHYVAYDPSQHQIRDQEDDIDENLLDDFLSGRFTAQQTQSPIPPAGSSYNSSSSANPYANLIYESRTIRALQEQLVTRNETAAKWEQTNQVAKEKLYAMLPQLRSGPTYPQHLPQHILNQNFLAPYHQQHQPSPAHQQQPAHQPLPAHHYHDQEQKRQHDLTSQQQYQSHHYSAPEQHQPRPPQRNFLITTPVQSEPLSPVIAPQQQLLPQSTSSTSSAAVQSPPQRSFSAVVQRPVRPLPPRQPENYTQSRRPNPKRGH